MKKKSSLLNRYFQQIITAVFWLLLILAYFHYKGSHNYSNEQLVKFLYSFLNSEGIYGGLIYISIFILRTIIFFPSSLLIILSPSLFGLPMAIIYTVLGENLSASFGYYLGKFFGKNSIDNVTDDKFTNMKKKMRESSFIGILTARLLFVPFDPLSYMAGFMRVEFLGYIFGTFIGTLPGIFIFIFIGAGIKNIEAFNLREINIDPTYMLVSLFMIIISILIVLYLKHTQLRKSKKHQN